jgi:hypothetical protein
MAVMPAPVTMMPVMAVPMVAPADLLWLELIDFVL